MRLCKECPASVRDVGCLSRSTTTTTIYISNSVGRETLILLAGIHSSMRIFEICSKAQRLDTRAWPVHSPVHVPLLHYSVLEGLSADPAHHEFPGRISGAGRLVPSTRALHGLFPRRLSDKYIYSENIVGQESLYSLVLVAG